MSGAILCWFDDKLAYRCSNPAGLSPILYIYIYVFFEIFYELLNFFHVKGLLLLSDAEVFLLFLKFFSRSSDLTGISARLG